MSGIVLDAGALLALERHDRNMWGVLRLAALQARDVLVPSTVLAQVWRGGRTQANLARALDHCMVAPFDPVSRRVGELCGKTGTRDIIDAHVALVASATSAVLLYTSDPDDLRRLLAACPGHRPAIVRC